MTFEYTLHYSFIRGLYLQDLTFLEEQPTRLEDGVSINFGKRWKQFKSVDHIRFAQTKLVCHYEALCIYRDPHSLCVYVHVCNLVQQWYLRDIYFFVYNSRVSITFVLTEILIASVYMYMYVT